jgi:hypothetical protein
VSHSISGDALWQGDDEKPNIDYICASLLCFVLIVEMDSASKMKK